MKLKKALSNAEWMGRQAAKNARTKALEEEEAMKIPYEVGGWVVVGCAWLVGFSTLLGGFT